MSPFELFATLTGLGAVVLLIRQNLWTWPLGVLYAVVSVWVFQQDRLYGQVLLHLFYVGMNLYGWWYWLYGGEREDEAALPVTSLQRTGWFAVLLGGGLAAAALGWLLGNVELFAGAEFAKADALITAFSFVAMYLQARKIIESWVLWFLIDVASVALYASAGLYFYALLYLVYLALAVAGYSEWRKTLITT